MRIVIEAEPDRRRLTRSVRHVLRRRLLPYPVCGAFVGLCGLILLVMSATAVGLGFVALGLAMAVAVPRLLVGQTVRHNWSLLGVSTTYEITDEGVRSISEHADSLVRWSAVRRLEDLGDQYLLVLGKLHFVALPVTGLSPEQRAAIGRSVRRP